MVQLKVATFNVNSVRTRIPILEKWLSSETAPEIICFQETKSQDENFPTDFFDEMGYYSVFKGMKSYNGVAIVSKMTPENVEFGLGDGKFENAATEESENARVVRARFGKLNILNTYIPQGKSIEHLDYPYKLAFLERIRNLLEREYKPTDRLLWVGDLNVAMTDIDVTSPKSKKEHPCFHTDVKESLQSVMSWGIVDIFRQHRPGEGEFTYWDYRVKDSLSRNIGWRIDHILGTKSQAALCTNVEVARDLRAMERPSDHTAVIATFKEA